MPKIHGAEPGEKAEEFFYLEGGKKQDADLHNPILLAEPIDEKIMKPIRDKHRKASMDVHAHQQKRMNWERAKAVAQKLLEKFNEADHPRDEHGRWTDAGGGDEHPPSPAPPPAEVSSSPHAKDPTSASSLLRIDNVTVSDLHDKVKDSREQDLFARARLRTGTPTDASEAEGGYKLPNGHWAPDRIPVHVKISQALMTREQVAAASPRVGEQPTLYILGGRGGSGKGWFTGKDGTLADAAKKSVYINNDDVKEALPEYRGWNAGHLHEEASHIAEGMEKYARDNKLNVIVDATLKSKGSLEKRIAQYKAAGYKISGHYMYASPKEAATRALGRFVSGNKKNGKGRFVPPEYSLGSTTNEDTFDSQRDKMDFWEVYDNMGESPKLHSRKK